METARRTPTQQAAAAGLRWGRRHPAVVSLLFALVYALAVAVGRATRPAGMPLALVWPAAAVGWLWLAASWHDRRRRGVDAVALALVAGLINVVTGASWSSGLGYGVSGSLQAVIACALTHHLQRRWGSAPWRLRRSGDVTALLVAAYGGAAVAAFVGTAALHLSAGGPVLLPFVSWVLRVGTSALVFAGFLLRLADPDVPPAVPDRRRAAEVLATSAVIAAGYTVVFALPQELPLAFVLVPLSLWVALRYSTTLATTHVLLVSVAVVTTTQAGRGPFTAGSVVGRVMLAQAFVAVIAMVTLLLALHRDDRQRLVVEAQAATQRADEQAALLRTVFDTTTDGLSVFDPRGRVLLSNPAAVRLLGRAPAGVEREQWGEHYGVFTPEGVLIPTQDLPLGRALGGEAVDGVDVLVRSARDPAGRVLHMSAHPMPPAPGAGPRGGAVVAFHDVTDARAAAQETARAHDLLAGVLDAATGFAILSTDTVGRLTLFNVGAERMLGYSAAEMMGRNPDVLHDAAEVDARVVELGLAVDGRHAAAAFTHVCLREGHESRQWTWLTRDGRRLQVVLTMSAIRDADGELRGFMGIARDISAELAAAADLADSEQRFRLSFDTAPIGMMMVGLHEARPGAVLRANPAMTRLLGHPEADLLAMNVEDFSHPDDLVLTREALTAHTAGGLPPAQVERRYLHADGSTVWVRSSTTVVRPHDGEAYSLALLEDITARKAAEDALKHQALHDGLTGLANRTLFTDRLEHALAAANRSDEQVGVLFLDLDGFKAVNDSAGHAAGDELLQQVAHRLSACTRPGDTLARLGGDEFAVVCPGLGAGAPGGGGGAGDDLHLVAERVLRALRVPFDLGAGTFRVGASIGLSLSGPGGADPSVAARQVVATADEAMYDAKRAGKNRAHGCAPQRFPITAST